ncbi:MAG: WecB/TagA/CpsF family glycosyltransferase [Hyphomicrobiaceae bacterium]|nr:WecB/TagA/CpsF family glycosyltransferase [Hyphomicrobiaceae bacterium]
MIQSTEFPSFESSAPQPVARIDAPLLASVDGWGINVATMSDAIKAITDAAGRGEGCAVFTLNLDHLVKLRRDAKFRSAYRSARFVTADGAPVARIARAQSPGIERTTGADLVLPLALAAAEQGLPVYLFGSEPGVLGRAGRRLVENTEGRLSIAGSEAPAMGFDPESAAADAAIDRIAASGARICFLALGAPKQELLAARAVARGAPVVFVCIGAALDFLAGSQTRAPRFLQNNGLEWIWRLATNPRRLATRYAQCALLLARLTFTTPEGRSNTTG